MKKELRVVFCIATLVLVMSAWGTPALAAQRTSMGQVYTYPPVPTTIYNDSSPTFLQGDAQGGSIALTPPTIDFGVATIDAQAYSTDYGVWGNAVRGPDGKYYWGAGDHSATTGGFNGALLMDYDPASKKIEIDLFSKDILGAGGEGKWHCRPEINPLTGDMYLIGFYNGDLIHYNIYTHIAENVGQPSPGDGWEEGTWDYRHNLYYGVGNGNPTTNSGGGKVLVYDTLNRKTVFAGLPVDSATGQTFQWSPRARMVDPVTGMFYGSDHTTHRLAKYNPWTNTFTLMQSKIDGDLRAWTNQPEDDGSFWIMDSIGDLYKFYPEQDTLQSMGKNWGTGIYTASIARSQDGKYLYYSTADSTPFASTGGPIIQYNTETNQRKAIAFLASFYQSAHSYKLTKIYGVALDPDDGTLFAIANGNIVGGARYPSILNIVIPVTERSPDPLHANQKKSK